MRSLSSILLLSFGLCTKAFVPLAPQLLSPSALGGLRPSAAQLLSSSSSPLRARASLDLRMSETPDTPTMINSAAAKGSPSKEKWRNGETWDWRGMPVRYAVLNQEGKGAALLLVHGFGASLEHWRDNAPELSKDRPVYVIDLLGFGFSAQPDIPPTFKRWGPHVWATQLCDFMTEVVLPASSTKKVVIAGNSLGGFSSLLAAGAGTVKGGEIAGLVLVNAAGSFLPPDMPDPMASVARDDLLAAVDTAPEPLGPGGMVGQLIKRIISFGGFILTREGRIESTLKLVYTDDKSRVDDDLVDLIKRPAMQENAFEVFFKTTLGGREGKQVSIDRLSKEVEDRQVPTLLLWGENDPWITMDRANRMMELMPSASWSPLTAGHCPHDEVPSQFNSQLSTWLTERGL